MPDITMDDDYISSGDVEACLTRLAALRDDAREGAERGEEEHIDNLPGIEAEIAAWEQLKEAYGDNRRWEQGATLIRDGYWDKYAGEVARNMHGDALDEWPCTKINWPAALEELKQDYQQVTVTDARGEDHLLWTRS